jgi:hypothetical protein
VIRYSGRSEIKCILLQILRIFQVFVRGDAATEVIRALAADQEGL